MRLISLEVENFLKFERLALEFPDGLTGILGPNGVGKSSLVEAIAWALYGSPASRTKNEGIPFRGNKPCRVALTLEIEGDEYRVVRELRGASCTASAEVAVNGLPSEVGTERVNRLVATRLGMDYRAFLVSFFARQKELDALVSWEPRDRKRYILRMLGMERAERAIEELRRDVTDIERELRARQAALPSLETLQTAQRTAREKVAALGEQLRAAQEALAATEKELRAGRERLEALEGLQRRYAEMERQRDLARQALENARSKEAIFADRVRDLRNKREELSVLEPRLQPLAELRARRQALDLAAGLEKRRLSLARTVAEQEKQAREMAEQAKELQKQSEARPRIEQAHAEAEAALARARAEWTDLQGKIRESESQITRTKKDGQRLVAEIKEFRELGKAGRCPKCKQALGESHTDLVAHMEGELGALRREHDDYVGFLEEDAARAADLQASMEETDARQKRLNLDLRRVAQAEARLGDVKLAAERNAKALADSRAELAEMGADGYDPALHRRVKAEVEALEKTEHRVIGLRHEVERLPAEEQSAAQARAAIPEREAALAQAEADLKALGFDPDAFQAHRQRFRSLEGERETRSQECHRIERERERVLVEHQQANDRLEEYHLQVGDIAVLRADKENRDELLAQMQAFRLNLIGRIRPALAARTSSLVRDLTDGKYDHVELDEDYNLSMFDEAEKRELRSFSGGETDLVHLCLRLAISEMIGDAAGGAQHGFLVLDEVMGSQDGERRSLILQALGRLSRRFRQILMITHIDDTKEMVEHVVELRETADGSSEIAPSDL